MTAAPLVLPVQVRCINGNIVWSWRSEIFVFCLDWQKFVGTVGWAILWLISTKMFWNNDTDNSLIFKIQKKQQNTHTHTHTFWTNLSMEIKFDAKCDSFTSLRSFILFFCSCVCFCLFFIFVFVTSTFACTM